MPTIGITGHINLTHPTRALVAAGIRRELSAQGMAAPIGLTSLAGGADQIFAEEVLAAGGSITFVRPCDRIEESLSGPDLDAYHRLLRRAAATVEMSYDEPSEEAYEAAGRYVADHCDLLLAVWDGQPAGGRGGTGDIVLHRRASGRPMVVIWPEGAARG